MESVLPRLLIIDKIPDYQSFFLFGPRGSGKSTLIQNYLKTQPGHLQYDLLRGQDHLRLLQKPWGIRTEVEEQLRKSPSGVLQVHIDEVQRIPDLLNEVHSMIESFPKKVRFILSGSSARKLRRAGTNLLAGRAWLKYLDPFTVYELGSAFNLAQALRFGMLPKAWEGSNEERQEYLLAYVNTYLREEIQIEAAIRKLDAFSRFLEAAAKTNGQLVNFSKLATEASVERKSVTDYYKILEDTLMGFQLPSWGKRQSRKDLVEHGKFYFADCGIVSALTGTLPGGVTPAHPYYGFVFEHFVMVEFMKLQRLKSAQTKTGFFRTRAGSEIDLIIEGPDSLRAIEIKSSPQLGRHDLSALKNFKQEFPQAECLVVYAAERSAILDGIRCVPWNEFLEGEIGA